jgi:hypothetical protein
LVKKRQVCTLEALQGLHGQAEWISG